MMNRHRVWRGVTREKPEHPARDEACMKPGDQKGDPAMFSRLTVAIVVSAAVLALSLHAQEALAQAQTKDQQKCTNAMNKELEKVSKTQGKNIADCIKNFAKGKTDQLGP